MQGFLRNTSVVIASLNEEEGIGQTLEELQKFMHGLCVVVVDGNSHDRTVEIAKNMGADVLLQEGLGKGSALFQGISHLGSKMRYIVFIDGDFTYPAEKIPRMIEILEQESDVGMVIGDRFNGEHNFQRTWINPFYFGNRLIALAQRTLSGIRLSDPLSGLRVVRSDILRDWKTKSKGFDVEAELNCFVKRKGYQIREIPINYRHRLGEKKLKLHHGFGILIRIISESFGL